MPRNYSNKRGSGGGGGGSRQPRRPPSSSTSHRPQTHHPIAPSHLSASSISYHPPSGLGASSSAAAGGSSHYHGGSSGLTGGGRQVVGNIQTSRRTNAIDLTAGTPHFAPHGATTGNGNVSPNFGGIGNATHHHSAESQLKRMTPLTASAAGFAGLGAAAHHLSFPEQTPSFDLNMNNNDVTSSALPPHHNNLVSNANDYFNQRRFQPSDQQPISGAGLGAGGNGRDANIDSTAHFRQHRDPHNSGDNGPNQRDFTNVNNGNDITGMNENPTLRRFRQDHELTMVPIQPGVQSDHSATPEEINRLRDSNNALKAARELENREYEQLREHYRELDRLADRHASPMWFTRDWSKEQNRARRVQNQWMNDQYRKVILGNKYPWGRKRAILPYNAHRPYIDIDPRHGAYAAHDAMTDEEKERNMAFLRQRQQDVNAARHEQHNNDANFHALRNASHEHTLADLAYQKSIAQGRELTALRENVDSLRQSYDNLHAMQQHVKNLRLQAKSINRHEEARQKQERRAAAAEAMARARQIATQQRRAEEKRQAYQELQKNEHRGNDATQTDQEDNENENENEQETKAENDSSTDAIAASNQSVDVNKTTTTDSSSSLSQGSTRGKTTEHRPGTSQPEDTSVSQRSSTPDKQLSAQQEAFKEDQDETRLGRAQKSIDHNKKKNLAKKQMEKRKVRAFRVALTTPTGAIVPLNQRDSLKLIRYRTQKGVQLHKKMIQEQIEHSQHIISELQQQHAELIEEHNKQRAAVIAQQTEEAHMRIQQAQAQEKEKESTTTTTVHSTRHDPSPVAANDAHSVTTSAAATPTDVTAAAPLHVSVLSMPHRDVPTSSLNTARQRQQQQQQHTTSTPRKPVSSTTISTIDQQLIGAGDGSSLYMISTPPSTTRGSNNAGSNTPVMAAVLDAIGDMKLDTFSLAATTQHPRRQHSGSSSSLNIDLSPDGVDSNDSGFSDAILDKPLYATKRHTSRHQSPQFNASTALYDHNPSPFALSNSIVPSSENDVFEFASHLDDIDHEHNTNNNTAAHQVHSEVSSPHRHGSITANSPSENAIAAAAVAAASMSRDIDMHTPVYIAKTTRVPTTAYALPPGDVDRLEQRYNISDQNNYALPGLDVSFINEIRRTHRPDAVNQLSTVNDVIERGGDSML